MVGFMLRALRNWQSSDWRPPPPVQPAPAGLPPNSHEIFGTIRAITGSNITLATRTGKLVRIDVADAARSNRSVVLLVGEPIMASGGYDGLGVLHATTVLHAKPSPKGWPADR